MKTYFLWIENATFELLKDKLLAPDGVKLRVHVVDDGAMAHYAKRLTVEVVEEEKK